MSKKTFLKTGYTTGTSASAATRAALEFLFRGKCPVWVEVPMPNGDRLGIRVQACQTMENGALATVIKDGGDDPDATHGARIQSHVVISPGSPPVRVELDGGTGVGRATLPGLPVKPGQAAINPAPRKQIIQTVLETLRDHQPELTGVVRVTIIVPEGERLAQKTMNARLGIVDGISILGTQGLVRPYSNESYRATISESLDVARAAGLDTVVFATGRRSERFYLELNPDAPALSVIPCADFFAYSLEQAGKRGFKRIGWTIFFGKLVKQAMGFKYTHAKDTLLDFDKLASWCAEAGLDAPSVDEARRANTARQVLAVIADSDIRSRLVRSLIKRAKVHASIFSGSESEIFYTVFDFNGAKLS